MAASFVGKLAVNGGSLSGLSFNFNNLTDAGGSPASIAADDVAIVVVSADQGSDGTGISISGFTRLGQSTDNSPVSALLVKTLTGSETSLSISDSNGSDKAAVSVAVYRGVSAPTSAIRTSGSGLGDPGNIEVASGEIVIAATAIDDIEVTDLGAPTGMTFAVGSTHDGGGNASTTSGIAHDLAPGVGFYNPGEFTGTGSDSDDAYIMVAAETGGAGSVTGTGVATLPAMVASGAGQVTRIGTAAASLPAITATGAGSISRSGAGAASLPAITSSGTGEISRTGSGSATLPAIIASGSGTASAATTGSGSAVLPVIGASGSGEVSRVGAGAATLPSMQVAASGIVARTGTGAASLPSIIAQGTGLLSGPPGTGLVSLPALFASGAGAVGRFGSAAISLPALTASGSGVVARSGSAAISLPSIAVAGSGTVITPSSGPVFVGKVTSNAQFASGLTIDLSAATDAAGDPAALTAGDIAILAFTADIGGTVSDLTVAGFNLEDGGSDASPVSGAFSRYLNGSETTIAITDTVGFLRNCSVAVAIYRNVSVPQRSAFRSGAGVGPMPDIAVMTDEIVIATAHVDDLEVTDLAAPSGFTIATTAAYAGGAGSSSTVSIAHNFNPSTGTYSPDDWSSASSDSADGILLALVGSPGLAAGSGAITLGAITALGAGRLANPGEGFVQLPALTANVVGELAVHWVLEDYDNNTNTSGFSDGRRWNYNMGYDAAGLQDTANDHALKSFQPDGLATLLRFEIRGNECANSDASDGRGRAEISGFSQDPLPWDSTGDDPLECWYYFPVVFKELDGQADWETFAQIYGMLSPDNAHIANPIVKFERRSGGYIEIQVGGATGITSENASTVDDRVTIWQSDQDVVLDQVYHWLVRFIPHGAHGELQVWCNGVELFNRRSIKIGWGERTKQYAKIGVYRDEDDLLDPEDYGTSVFIYALPEQATGVNALASYRTSPPEFHFYGDTFPEATLTGTLLVPDQPQVRLPAITASGQGPNLAPPTAKMTLASVAMNDAGGNFVVVDGRPNGVAISHPSNSVLVKSPAQTVLG